MPRRSSKESCPQCGSPNVLRIVYGLPADPSSAGAAAAKRERITFGGCSVTFDSPTHQCADCEHQWEDRRRERAEQEEAPANRRASET